jgi:hypothetical protein
MVDQQLIEIGRNDPGPAAKNVKESWAGAGLKTLRVANS